MADSDGEEKKRKIAMPSGSSKRLNAEDRGDVDVAPATPFRTAGKIDKICVRNFMCHDLLQIDLNANTNFIIGRNGSGKSALLTALTVGLGARAQVTNRGGSVQEFIKKGKNSSTIEITLMNEGPMAFKPDEYGKKVTVVRSISASASQYKLKSAAGKVISTKKEELDHLLSIMNIQVENPISVLNQDVSRTFLTTSSAKDKYDLMMKATQLDIVANNYREAQLTSEEARNRLNTAKEHLAESRRETEALEKKLKTLDQIEESRQILAAQELELVWALAIAEETELQSIMEALAAHEETVKELESVDGNRQLRENEIAANVAKLEDKIREVESEFSGNSNVIQQAQDNFHAAKEAHANKKREWLTGQTQIRRAETDIGDLCQEIQRLETVSEGAGERARMKEELAKLEIKIAEYDAMLQTKQTEQVHLAADKTRLEQEEHAFKIEAHHREIDLNKMKNKLAGLMQQSDSPLTIYGNDMPRLLKRIEEEYKKGRFREKPLGPIGSYIKIKDPAWTPAVEKYLGAATLHGFAVDNAKDGTVLTGLINEIFKNQRPPAIITSKFISQMHDVSRHRVCHPQYNALFDVMEISNNVVANCVIDQREPECALLIPVGTEAAALLSERHNVPANCKIGLTLKGEEFFPDPNYRSYACKLGRPKLLQVSTKEAISTLQEELCIAEEEHDKAVKLHRVARSKWQACQTQLNEINTHVASLKTMRMKTASTIASIEDAIKVVPDNTTDLREDKVFHEKKLEELREKDQLLLTEMNELRDALKKAEDEVASLRQLRDTVQNKVEKLKEQIRALDDEKKTIALSVEYAQRKILEARKVVQKVTAKLEVQKRATDKAVADAEARCPRIDTARSVKAIKRSSAELSAKVRAVEENVGTREVLVAELAAKRAKYTGVIDYVKEVNDTNERHLVRLRKRQDTLNEVRKCIGDKVQNAFSCILKLREYNGTVKISHSRRTLELEVTPHNTSRMTDDARKLSGGERSYSTVAFILALWDCTGLPFYFLDEFDVFMDKINRRTIIDLLLLHTREHPQSQFAFLTPLDTSVEVGPCLTIHQLAPPEREGNNQE